jgi:cytoskeletal protein CcmA (bactofilin family)
MLQSNSNFERAGLPERAPHAGAAGSGPGYASTADDPETRQIPVLGKTLLFRGELTAEEDVILQGRVEGSIRHARNLIIGTDGSVLGDVYASHLTVEGLVEGDLHCTEAVIVRATAQVRGNIFAPRVGIMEGALFNGRVEMDPGAAALQAGQAGSRQSTRQGGASPRAASAPTSSAPGRSGGAAAAASSPARQGASNSAAATPASAAPASGASTGSALSNSAVDQMLSAQTSNRK